MNNERQHHGQLMPFHGKIGMLLVAAGEGLIIARMRPLSDYYFPTVWLGFVLLLDATVKRQTGRSLWCDSRRALVAMFCLSVGFWWLFELLNQAIHNWRYVGTEPYSDIRYVVFASLDFSLVLPAVWCAALAVLALLPRQFAQRTVGTALPWWLPPTSIGAGAACLVLSITAPSYAFGAIWLCIFLLADPLNHRLGRPSMLAMLWNRQWRLPLAFALGTLLCGVFWEGWNYWSMPKWIYTIPHVGFWHVFEMPLLGWSGYLPFGLELFAMTTLVLPFLRIGESSDLTSEPGQSGDARAEPVPTAGSSMARRAVRGGP